MDFVHASGGLHLFFKIPIVKLHREYAESYVSVPVTVEIDKVVYVFTGEAQPKVGESLTELGTVQLIGVVDVKELERFLKQNRALLSGALLLSRLFAENLGEAYQALLINSILFLHYTPSALDEGDKEVVPRSCCPNIPVIGHEVILRTMHFVRIRTGAVEKVGGGC